VNFFFLNSAGFKKLLCTVLDRFVPKVLLLECRKMRPSSKICPPKFLNIFLDSFRLTVICNRANLSARDGWKSSKVFNVVFDCFPAHYNLDFHSNITDVVNKHQMRFHSSLNENNIHWETLPSTQDLFTTISRRYSHAACYYGIGFL
jgi:hypothetical protein